MGVSAFSVIPPLFGWPASSVRISCVPQLGGDSGRGLKLRYSVGKAWLSGDFSVSGPVPALWSQAQDVPMPTHPLPPGSKLHLCASVFMDLKWAQS